MRVRQLHTLTLSRADLLVLIVTLKTSGPGETENPLCLFDHTVCRVPLKRKGCNPVWAVAVHYCPVDTHLKMYKRCTALRDIPD